MFEPFENSIYIYRTNRKEITKHEIGENSKDVLLELIESKKCLSTEELLENIWRNKRKSEVDITSVRQAVSKLRKSFSFVAPEIDIIKTIPRKGYLLNAKVILLDECSNHKRHPLGIVFYF
ncbi:winged helix-turn-helix domain-containing protein [Vibrio owensii]|uniref:winged helix-turn-helix domain-containing protein n=1 Tax=Vibrio owensii TaxID=696485 RepID=UPI00391B8497